MNIENHIQILEEKDDYIHDLVRTQMDILDRIHFLLDKYFDGSQAALAVKMGISEARVSKMVNGLQNFTLSTLKKLEQAFGENIIVVPCDYDHEDIQIDGYISTFNPTSLNVDTKGEMVESQKLIPSTI